MEFGERVLFVHAHPDDETLATGVAVATITEDGGTAGVLTLTLGEAGEHTAEVDDEVARDGIVAVRTRELRAALEALGGEAVEPTRRWRDSGMTWGSDGRAAPGAEVPADALTAASLGEVAEVVQAAIEAFVPTAIVTYDADGGYGHPDHERVHAAVVRAAAPFAIPVYARVTDGRADVELDAAPVADRVRTALDAYRSQLALEGDSIVHVGGQREPVHASERYRTVATQAPLGPVTIGLIAVIGVVVGVVGTFAHQAVAPWGAVLAVLGAAGVIVGPRLLGSRAASIAGALGVLAVIGIAALDPLGRGAISADGGLIPANPAGWLWALGPAAIALVTIGWPSGESMARIRAAAASPSPRA